MKKLRKLSDLSNVKRQFYWDSPLNLVVLVPFQVSPVLCEVRRTSRLYYLLLFTFQCFCFCLMFAFNVSRVIVQCVIPSFAQGGTATAGTRELTYGNQKNQTNNISGFSSSYAKPKSQKNQKQLSGTL